MIEYSNDKSEMINLFKKRGKLSEDLKNEAKIKQIDEKIK
jgi:hypothetical protein